MTTIAPELALEDEQEQPSLCFDFSQMPTMDAFIHCDWRIVVLIGPEGEGKTYGSVAALFKHVERVLPLKDIDPKTGRPFPMQACIVRDTHANIKRHMVKSIEKAAGGYVEFHQDHHKMIAPDIECDLLGMDDEASSARLQGGEYDLIWVEEPAPVIHTGNAGMNISVYRTAQRRIRGGRTPKRLQVSMNPASTDHWTHMEFIQRPLPIMKVFRIKKGENPFLSKEDRDARALAFRDRPDLAKRYDEGDFGAVWAGIAITPEFSERIHVAADSNGNPYWLLPIRGVEGIRLWDGGLNPSCVILQITPSGHINFLDCIVGENMGMRQMIKTKLKPVLARPRYENIFRWRDIGDPAINTRDQSDSDQRAANVIEEELSTSKFQVRFESGVSDWNTRREGLKEMFSRNIDGKPTVQINHRPTEGQSCNWLIMLFSGGYQYPVNAVGQVNRDGPLKNLYCVDEDTEILTQGGWKRRPELVAGEMVYGYESKRLRLTPLLDVFHDEGTHPGLHFTSQTLDMLVTMNHRCIANHRWDKGVRIVEAAALCASDAILRAAPYTAQTKRWYSDQFVRLCAWIMAEGTYGSGRSGAITIVQSADCNAAYCEEITSLVEHFRGRNVGIRQTTHGRMQVWQLSGEIVEAIKAVMPNKIASSSFIHRMTNPQRRLFLYEMIRADGHWRDGSCLPAPQHWTGNDEFFVRTKTPRVYQKERKAIDALQAIATLAGMRATINRKSAPGLYDGWSISFTRQGAWTSVNKLDRRTVQLQGVWCPRTTLGTWVARRNGRVFITGNSHPGDAISHGIPILLFPHTPAPQPNRGAQKQIRARAAGYAVRDITN